MSSTLILHFPLSPGLWFLGAGADFGLLVPALTLVPWFRSLTLVSWFRSLSLVS